MRICYRCEKGTPDSELQWKSSDNSDRGMCQRCHAISKMKEEMEHETFYEGVRMSGFEHIRMHEGEKIVCPYCRDVEHEAPEDPSLYEEQDYTEYSCNNCGMDFLLSVHVSITYVSKRDIRQADAEKLYMETQNEKGNTKAQDTSG
jgi:DNA-directed RNA polymerase subunit RPC12/RpoP